MSEESAAIMKRLCQRSGFSMLEEGLLKLDLDVGIEKVWPLMLYGSAFLMIMSICAGTELDILESQAKWPGVLFCVSALLLVLAYFSWFRTDNFYILDHTNRRLLYHRKFFMSSIDLVASYSDIEKVSVSGIWKMGDEYSGPSWTYQIVLMLANGRLVAVSQPTTDGVNSENAFAQDLASLIATSYSPGEAERQIIIDESGVNIAYRPLRLTLGQKLGFVLALLGLVYAILNSFSIL